MQVPLDWYAGEHSWAERNAIYVENAVHLLAEAATRCLEQTGRSFADIDALVTVSTTGKASNPPRRGAVTTFLWDDGWAHVSFYLGEVGNYVICLGGNQSDTAWISVYHKKYVTSYRVY